MKNFFAIILLAMLNILSSYAQTTDKGSIRGKVVEEIGGLAIPFAVVSVSEGNSEVPMQTLQTSELGAFIFDKLKAGIYRIKVSYVGYNTVVVNDIEISDSDYDKNTGSVKLSTTQSNLNEVVISANKPLIENDGDMITYNVGSSIYAEGSSAVDLLKDVPMVEVDIDGKPTISGMRSTRVFINGRPSDYMTANITDLLNVLPSDAVEKIEVMTNPPAKYSADGEGIINIVLRKDFKVGFNGNIGAGVNTMGNRNINTGASYRGKKFAVNGGGSVRQSFSESSNKNYRTNNPNGNTNYYHQFSNSDGESDGMNARVGFDWDIDKKRRNNLKISSNFSNSDWDGLTVNDFHYLNKDMVETRLRKQENTSNVASNTFVVNADYALTLDTLGHRLGLQFTANNNNNDAFRVYDYVYEPPSKPSPYLQHNNGDVSNRGFNVNVDYEKPFFKRKGRLEIGAAATVRQNDSDQDVNIYNFSRAEFVKSERLSSNFVYNEKIYATYASFNYRSKEWTARASLRGEYTNVNFDLVEQKIYNLEPYWNVFPSASITRRIKKSISLGLTYGLRINRPRETTLNPQINNADTLNISYGNPELNPSFTHQLGFNFAVYGMKWSFTPRITYSRATQVIERFRFVNEDGVSETTFDNVGSNYYLSYILIGNYRPSKKISLNGNFTLINSSYSSTLNKALNRDGYSMRSRFGASMQLHKGSAFEASLNYDNNMVAQGRNRSSIATALGFRQNFLKNRLSARFSATDPFRGKHTYNSSEGTNFYSSSYGVYRTNNFAFNLNYRFSKIKTNKVVVPPAKKVIGKTPVKKADKKQ